jgi:molecular chaperone GrpE
MEIEEPNKAVEPPTEKKPELRVVDRRWWARGETSASVESAERKPTYVEDLERRVSDLSTSLQSALSERRRAIDEFDQVKSRIRRDVGREVERGRRVVLTELLEVLDNLDRAIDAARQSEGPNEAQALLRGVELVRDLFRAKLEGFGVRRLSAARQPFDASQHEAVATAPVTDPAEDGLIVAVVKEGYAIGEELLRPASVVVGKLTVASGD